MALPASPPAAKALIRVLIVDDSAVVRGLVLRWLQVEDGIEIAGIAMNGREAVTMAGKLQPDVIILDVEMPELDGLGAIPQILKDCPHARILMASTLTQRNAEITLKALSLGAADYVPKPETGKIAAAADFKRDLIARVRALGARTRRAVAPAAQVARPAVGAQTLRPGMKRPAEIIVVGSSTGGPQALSKLITQIGGRLRTPVLIVQHMPAMFTAILAEQLNKASPAPVVEAKDGMPLKAGSIYIAPGDFHMRVVRRHGAAIAQLDQGPPVNFCRPAVDPLFASAAEFYGDATLGAILTGMGSDGRAGAQAIVAKGGAVIVQDEASSVVWGMPGACYNSGLAAAIRPIDELGQTLTIFAQGRSA
jgi:two-component system chemotaxis response regulator CheB